MRRLIGVIVLGILLVVYLSTLQTIPNGSEHYYMIDVGETQNVLNQWGTLHATGYPLYVIVGNILVAVMRTLGMNAATAPGVTSLIYGMVALGLIYVLAVNLPHAPSPSLYMAKGSKMQAALMAAGMVLLFGLTRTVWVHNSIAEVYTFGLMILAGLFLIALWPEPIRGRVYWLALLGGIGAFHHRAIGMAAPALVFAVWGEIFARNPQPLPSSPLHGRRGTNPARQYWPVVRRVGICLVLGLLGFVQYAYLPLRANAGAKWVYGDPGNWNGFWDQFLGREASRFIGTPSTNAGLVANFNLVNTVLVTDVSAVGIVLGLLGLLVALRNPARRKLAITMLLSGGVAYGFHVLYYTDILSALILPVTLALAFGWLLLAEWTLGFIPPRRGAEPPPPVNEGGSQSKGNIEPQRRREKAERLGLGARVETMVALGFLTALCAVLLISQNWLFIHDMTTNPTGLETIELAKSAPDGSVLMLDWGPRYYAVAFAQDLLGELPKVTLVTHKADFKALEASGRRLVTADFTFYNRPVDWWQQQIGRPVYLQAAAPHLVAIATQPMLADDGGADMIKSRQVEAVCTASTIELRVDWLAVRKPDHDLSVYVHLLDKSGAMIGQADEVAPVYGWRPLTSWEAGEVVHDVYGLPRLPNADHIDYGLYRQLASGEFQNEYTFSTAVKCDG